MFKQSSNRRPREARRGSAFCPQAKFRILSVWNCKIYTVSQKIWIMILWNICFSLLTDKDITHLRKDGSQADVHTQARGFLSSLKQVICTFFSHYEFDFSTFIVFCNSELDFSISCDAEDLSWRRDVSEGIVAGRGVSWLFCRLNTCVGVQQYNNKRRVDWR